MLFTDTFIIMLGRRAPEWWRILKEAGVRLGYLLLCSRVSAGLTVSQEDVMRTIKETIDWRRMRRNDAGWNPTGGKYDNSFFIQILTRILAEDLQIEPLVSRFQADLNDAMFCDLVARQFSAIPAIFFNRVRASIQLLIRPRPAHSSYRFPEFPMFSDQGELSDDTKSRLTTLVEWDPRWGYSHWHRITHDTSGFTVSSLVRRSFNLLILAQCVWFEDTGTRNVIWHTLRAPSSIGWFAVYYPQEFEPYHFTTDVPITIETISFVLAAVSISFF